MASKFCNICQNSRVEVKPKWNKLDMIERTTSCRLILGGGASLKVSEVQTKVDEEAKQKNMTCLCQVSSSKINDYYKNKQLAGTSGGMPSSHCNKNKGDDGSKRKKSYLVPGKLKTTNKKHNTNDKRRIREEKMCIFLPTETTKKHLHRQFLKDSLEFKKHLHDFDEACVNKFCKILKPKWFIPFTTKQIYFLKRLPSAIEDDVIENVVTRTKKVLTEIGIRPKFPDSIVIQTLKLCRNNPVILLTELRRINALLPVLDIDENFPNEQILMSSICWFELPFIIGVLLKRLPQDTINASTNLSNSNKTGRFSCIPREEKNPYLKPVFTNKPFDWLKERNITDFERRKKGFLLRQIMAPEDAKRNAKLPEHIEFPPLIDHENRDSIVDSTEDLCCVVAAFQLSKMYLPVYPSPPPASRHNSKDSLLAPVSDVLNAVLDRIEELSSPIPQNGEGDSFDGVMQLLNNIGAKSTSFPDIQYHPSIAQLLKNIKKEEMTKALKTSLWSQAISAKRCLGNLYPELKLRVPKMKNYHPNWSCIVGIRKICNINQQKFLDDFLNWRIKNSINFYHTLNPTYFSKHSFNKTFFAYMTSTKGNVNFWPNRIKL